MASTWISAAKHLEGHTLTPVDERKVRALFDRFAVPETLTDDARVDLVRLLRVADCLKQLSPLINPHMEGFSAFGAIVDPRDFGTPWGEPRLCCGVGFGVLQALRACLGETVEHVSQYAQATPTTLKANERVQARSLFDDWLKRSRLEQNIDWIEATTAVDGYPSAAPADLCWRRSEYPSPLSSRHRRSLGCAAGPTPEFATRAAILELVERDALALWWEGGVRGRAVPFEILAGTTHALEGAWRDNRGRETWMLDITSDLGIPVIVVMSRARDGRDFAFGVKAGTDRLQAAKGALRELCLLEIADLLVATHVSENEAALSETDRIHIERRTAVNLNCPLLYPDPVASSLTLDYAHLDSAADLARHLAALGHEIVLVDQTMPSLGVPVVRAFAPSLQPYPSGVVTARLTQRTMTQTSASINRPRLL